MNSKDLMNRAADNIRILIVSMVEKAKSGHPGGAMGGADFINVLFSEFLVYDPDDPLWTGRDRFYLDPGHMSPMLYAALCLQGRYTLDELQQFRQWQSPTPGHPELNVKRGIENTSGPLGQGHAYAVGAAMAEKMLAARLGDEVMQHKIYSYISDGGIQEEISQGAGRIAGLLGLDNLIMFYDANDIQLSTECRVVTDEDTEAKYKSWGWNVINIDGNDADDIRKALNAAQKPNGKPTLIIGKTVMGKGARKDDGSSYEHNIKTHGAPIGAKACYNTVKYLGGDPEKPFQIFPEVQELYAKRADELRQIVASRRAIEKTWADNNPDKAAMMKEWFSGKAPKVDWSGVVQKRDVATRVASSVCLGVLAEQLPNMMCSSADLSNSDKTEGFLNKTRPLARGDFGGAFLHAGVSELTMACLCIGMYLHGGIIPSCGTFFVFSDYMKPAIRMAALMEVPMKFIFSHDAFRVGEDGPTHQPVEQEVEMRLLEKLKNHKGKDSVRVFRPADSGEVTVCWQMAMENMDTPTVLIFSRQAVTSLPVGTPYDMARKGAYIVSGEGNDFDVILLADGSEVSTLVAGAQLLQKDGIKTRIVSVPSEGLFRQQSKEYQESVLPKGAKIFGLTAGMPVTLEPLAGFNGKVFGLNSFGYSAPYKVLDEKFGFTAANVYDQVKAFLAEK